MRDKIIFLGTVLPDSGPQIGQKAASLNELTLAGFPVPPGICISIDAYQAAIAPFAERIEALKASHDLRDPTEAQRVAAEIATLLDGMQLPAELRRKILAALPALGGEALAVRSSATLEDLGSASFAGQYRTVLGVKDEAALINAILACWRSFFSPNALAAQAAYGGRPGAGGVAAGQGMAVLIQPLLNAECAGVCFTVDPVRQRADWLLVTAAWGLGIGVVDGRVPVDTVRVRRLDLRVEEAFVADKHTSIRPDGLNGVQPVAVAADQRRLACLPEGWLQRVAQFGLAAEQHLGRPQDVEWAIAGQQLWLLQSRPITTLPDTVQPATYFPIAWASELERRRSWWLEQPRTLLPTEIEFFKVGLRGGQEAVAYRGGTKTRWRKYVNGRAYMTVADSPVSPADSRIRQAALQDLFERLQQQGITRWDYWGPEIKRATDRLAAFDPSAAEGSALADHLEDTLAVACRHWMIHTLPPRSGQIGPLLTCYRQLTGKDEASAEEDLPLLLQGAETIQSRLAPALFDLAALALQTPALATLLQSKAADKFLEMIALYLPIAAENPEASPQKTREQSDRAFQARIEAICALAPEPTLATAFRRQVDYARRDAAFLDEHNHYIDQLSHGQYSQALIYAGRRLADRGDLAQPYDVFWLELPEILAALRAQTRQNFDQVLTERREQFQVWRTRLSPAYIGLPEPWLPDRPPTEAAASQTIGPQQTSLPQTLRGQAASSGKGTGRARIISQSTNLPDIAPGDVLVAANADPLWTPLFPILAGLILDEGSPGDHAAITAREFGIPAVFGTLWATRHIPPNAQVTVDAATGLVTWS
jgi:pyruvate,water dikinase